MAKWCVVVLGTPKGQAQVATSLLPTRKGPEKRFSICTIDVQPQ